MLRTSSFTWGFPWLRPCSDFTRRPVHQVTKTSNPSRPLQPPPTPCLEVPDTYGALTKSEVPGPLPLETFFLNTHVKTKSRDIVVNLYHFPVLPSLRYNGTRSLCYSGVRVEPNLYLHRHRDSRLWSDSLSPKSFLKWSRLFVNVRKTDTMSGISKWSDESLESTKSNNFLLNVYYLRGKKPHTKTLKTTCTCQYIGGFNSIFCQGCEVS